MASKRRPYGGLAVAITIVLALAGCAAATPAWGPGSPRNGADQYVDPVYGTPLPGQTMGYN
jgi:hypothetical protein